MAGGEQMALATRMDDASFAAGVYDGRRMPAGKSHPRSPLRYPGGKSRAVATILGLLPAGLPKLCSPFVGGGSVELAAADAGVEVWGYDAFLPVVNFWRQLLHDAPALARRVARYYPLSRDSFYQLQKQHADIADEETSAAVFFALNRSSFSGTTLSGGMSPGHPRFTRSAIARLASFHADNFHVARADFTQSIARHADAFLYLDPPYCIAGNLYGRRGDHHKNFDHAGLAELLRARDRWLLSYNDCPQVRELYRGHRFLPARWAYGMNASRTSNEVFIVSDDYVDGVGFSRAANDELQC